MLNTRYFRSQHFSASHKLRTTNNIVIYNIDIMQITYRKTVKLAVDSARESDSFCYHLVLPRGKAPHCTRGLLLTLC